MCTGLVAICICNHYQVLRWTTRCLDSCFLPSNHHFQRVDFQCHGCDALDQEILELDIAAQARVRDAARETNRRMGAWARRRGSSSLSEAERVALRRMAVAEQTEKELQIAGELSREVERVVGEWRVRLEGVVVREEERRE